MQKSLLPKTKKFQKSSLIPSFDDDFCQTKNTFLKIFIFVLLFLWSLFQLWYASPLPFSLNFFILNDTEARSAHLAFAIFLAFLLFPIKSNNAQIDGSVKNFIIGMIGAFCTLYILIFYTELSNRPGDPITIDLLVSVLGIIILLEASRRSLGSPLMIVAGVFMIYAFAGPYMPDIIAHKGASIAKGMSHFWLSTEGVFGIALGVSTSLVFMFVLFGSLLERAGAGNYFIQVAFAAMGHMRGGPAKAAVVSSAMTGMVSGSSIANVVTTGTFTIPLMRKVGFSREKSGAIEVASSTNGQITPPIMGAAAFLMVEYVGISYIEVIKHAFFPAIIAYISLIYIVHLEACKADLQGLPRRNKNTFSKKLFSFLITIFSLFIISGIVYFGLGWIKSVFHEKAIWIIVPLLLLTYIWLLKIASEKDDLVSLLEFKELPDLKIIASSGYYFLLPVVVLVWSLTVERLSAELSAFWATIFMIFILMTQQSLKNFFRGKRNLMEGFYNGLQDVISGFIYGAKNMIGIGVATAAAGLIVGTVTLTGIGLVMTEFVEFISGGNFTLVLIFTAIISLILGMGLPTTANYIVVSTLMAPVIVTLGAESGFVVPLVAVHLFVFYFGILADDTPPVGLAAFAAAAISKGDPIKTGIQGFTYDLRTAILPFMFIFNTELLMIGIDSWIEATFVILGSTVGMLAFASATQGYLLHRSKWWEIILLLIASFILLRPSFIWDEIYPPYFEKKGPELIEVMEQKTNDDQLRVKVRGQKINGEEYIKLVTLKTDNSVKIEQALEESGIELKTEKQSIMLENIKFGSNAEKAGFSYDQEILAIQIPTERPAKQWAFTPALIIILVVILFQKKRKIKSIVSTTM
tara:strand:- start:1271 stop:3856 length:2586 start_codon:yes stop_codon:yes gene_type:complete